MHLEGVKNIRFVVAKIGEAFVEASGETSIEAGV